eukprot:Gb_16661 [translate_table: standard]
MGLVLWNCRLFSKGVVHVNLDWLACSNSVHSFTSTLALKGSIGYMAPEYGVGGEVSSKGDVYSYGILLLELFTRKWPINEMFEGDLNLHKWVRSVFPNGVVEVADSCLFIGAGREETEENEPNFKQCLISLLHVGLLCTKESPQERSTMRDVVRMLESLRASFVESAETAKLSPSISDLVRSKSAFRNVDAGVSDSQSVPLPHHKAPTFGIHGDLSAILEKKEKFKLDAFDEFSSGAASMLSFRVFVDSHLFGQCSGWIISILITMMRP